jgi:hypothetical protein
MNCRSPNRIMPERPTQTAIEDQLWPIACATAVLVGVLAVVVLAGSDFDDERLLVNGYTHLAAVAILGAAIIYLGSKIRGTARRTAELAILLSLALHAVGGLSAVYLFNSPLAAPGRGTGTIGAAMENEIDDDSQLPTDYHWGQNDDEQQAAQAFEKPVETAVREQFAAATQIQPRDLLRPVPAAEISRNVKPDVTPLGPAADPLRGEPGKPLIVRRSDAAKGDDLPPPEALAMARQKGPEPAIPDAAAPSPIAMPDAAKESPKVIEPNAVQAVKADKYIWAKVAAKSIDPNNASVPPPRKIARTDEPSSDALPSPNIIARVPSQAPLRISPAGSGPEAADEISQRGSTRVRSDRGGAMPSSLVPDAGPAPQLPAALGGSPGSRLETPSNVAVERSNDSHAPLGPSIASAGTQEFARGSSLLPTRRGALDGRGRAEPSIEGGANSDAGELRSGSPGSNLPYGLAQPVAPARRAVASQTEDGGAGPSAGQSATLPRTQAEMGLPLPASTRIADDSGVPGGGGVATRPGGMTSGLNVGQNVAVQRVAGNGPVLSRARDAAPAGSGIGDTPLSGLTGGNGPMSGLGAVGPRRIEQGVADGDDNGVGSIPRRRADAFDPRATVDPVGPIAGSAAVPKGPVQGAGPRGYSSPTIGPEDALGGTERLYGSGIKIGTRPTTAIEPTEIASSIGLATPQPPGLPGRGRQSDGSLDQVFSGGEGTGGINRGRGQIVVNSLVHEPLDAFRRGPDRGGSNMGDSGDGQLTEPAIENGLTYFSHTQFPDGHWSLHEAPPGVPLDPSSLGDLHADTAATGLALLAYMAAGYTQQDEKYRDTVRRGLQWLIKHQAADGNLSYHGSDPTHFYSQGIATMALCEAYGMTQDRDLREAAQKAIDFIVRSQDPNRGGWRYVARDGADTSVTGWQLMALRSAQMAGLTVPDETLRRVSHWLDLAQVPGRGTYVYNPWNLDTSEERKGRAPNPTMTAQAMIMRMFLGQDKDQVLLRQGADYVLAHLPEPAGAETSFRDCYYWYYATQAMYHMQGDYWKAWDARVIPLVRLGQVERGPLKGSWSGSAPVPDIWNSKAGRHYVTAMRVLTLEFRYWHLPLFRELRRE